PSVSSTNGTISPLPKAARQSSTHDLGIRAAAGAHHHAAALHRMRQCQTRVSFSVGFGAAPCQPRSELFGPLAACTESRNVWMGHYEHIRGYIDMQDEPGIGTNGRTNVPHNIYVDLEYICYETDIFTVFKTWNPGHTGDYPQPETFTESWDPFFGLDRSRIQHAGLRLWCTGETFNDAVAKFDIGELPALRTLSLITLGPDPGLEQGPRPGWVRMSPLALQRDFYFELRDISLTQLQRHPMFSEPIIGKRNTTADLDTPFSHLIPWAKAWLWPFEYTGWNNTSKEMLEDVNSLHWDSRFEVKLKFLCEKQWLADLERVGLFDDNRTNARDFDAFYKLRKEEMDRRLLAAARGIIRAILARRMGLN
ncbi:uncharacterized protein B0H64DRAFT_332283, partial [Chaetomium fimeti]